MGKDSQKLEWRAGVIFKKQKYGTWCGCIVNCSICNDGKHVVEVYPDKTFNKVVTASQQQQETIRKLMTEEEKLRYADNSMTNLRPSVIKGLPINSNYYGRIGTKILNSTLLGLIEENKTDEIFSHLNHIKLNNHVYAGCHIASPDVDEVGDISYFYFNNDQNDKNILNHINADVSEESAWEVYLILKATHIMPYFWHGAYHSRRFIFDEADVNDIPQLNYYDLSQLAMGGLLLPSVKPLQDGESFEVSCTYWNGWKGLIRECIVIVINPLTGISIKEENQFTLFEYKSEICL